MVPWWFFFIIVFVVFFVVLFGHYFFKKLNEARLDERLTRLHERTSVSTQVSLVIDNNKKKESNKNLKEDRRSKSVSLIFNTDKANNDLTDPSKDIENKEVKYNSSGDLKAFSSDGSSLNVPLHVKSLPEKLNVHSADIFGKDNYVSDVEELNLNDSKAQINVGSIKTDQPVKISTLRAIIDDDYQNNDVTTDKRILQNVLGTNKDVSKVNINNSGEDFRTAKVSIPNITLSSIRNDSNMKSNITIQREPSSLFFGAICGTPSTPKEILERYENAFASAKSSKLEARLNIFDDNNVSERKHVAETSTSRHKFTSELISSKENLSTTISKVTFNPETKKSYIENILNEKPIKKPESVSKLSVTTSKLSQTKDVSKCTSKVTFANTEIVIKDSCSAIEKSNVCLIIPSERALANDSETVCASEIDLEDTSNLDESLSNIDSNDVRKNPFKQSFIGEIVTVGTNTYKTSTNEIRNIDIELSIIEDAQTSQTSLDINFKKKSEVNVLEQMALFNTKLTERLSILAIDEATTSRSINMINFPEVFVVNNNKFIEDVVPGKQNKENIVTAFERNVDYSNKTDIEFNEGLMKTASFNKLKHKTTQEDARNNSENIKDDSEDVGE